MSCHILRNVIKAIIYFILFSCKKCTLEEQRKGRKSVYKSVSPSVPRKKEKERNCSFHTLAQKCCSVWVHIYAPGEGGRRRQSCPKQQQRAQLTAVSLFLCVSRKVSFLSPPPDTQIYGLLKRASSPLPFPPNTTSGKKYLFSSNISYWESLCPSSQQK